jgi:hypothetical protein
MRAALVSTVLAVGGCGASSRIEWIGLPDLTGARTLVAAYEASGDAPDVRVIDLAAASARIFPLRPLDSGVAVMLEALTYPESPSDLGLHDGELETAPPGTPGMRIADLRSNVARIFHRSVAPSLDAAWTPSASVSAALSSVRVPIATSTACTAFDLTRVTMTGTIGSAGTAVTLDAESALITTYDGLVFRVRGGAIQTLTLTGTDSDTITSAMVDQSGELWIAKYSGGLFRGRVTGDQLALEQVSRAPMPQSIGWMDGNTDPSSFEILLLSWRGLLWRFDGQTWTLLYQFSSGPSQDHYRGGVAYLGRRQALAALDSDSHIYRLDDRVATAIAAAPGTLDTPTALIRTERLGPVASVGTDLYVYREPAFVAIWNDYPSTSTLDALAPFGSGVLGASYDGWVQQYLPSSACPGVGVKVSLGARFLARAGADVVLAGNTPAGSSFEIALLRPRSAQ